MAKASILSSKCSIVNLLLIILYLYQYGLLIPLLVRFNSQAPIAVFTVFLFLIFIFVNGFPKKIQTYLLVCMPLLLIILKTAFTPILMGEDNTKEILLSFLTIGVSGILIGSVSFDFEKFLYYGTIIGWINFFILFSIPLQKVDAVNYMRFGYAMLPTVCFALYSFLQGKNRIINGGIALVSIIEVAIFGARGAFLVICIFALMVFFFFLNNRKNLKVWIWLLLGMIALFLFYETIIYEIDKMLESFGYSSYSITKILRIVEGMGDIESTSSGRFDIYQVALRNISENPIFGAPLNSALADTGVSYYHNIFLDIFVSFGFIIFICFVLFIFRSFIKMIKSDNAPLRWIYCILFVLSFGRLMVSSVFWQRPEFWLFIGFYTTNSKFFCKK